MNETKAIVTGIEGEYALVRTAEGGGCGRCNETGGCGGANISQMLCSKEREWRVLNPRGARVGEPVTVVVEDGALRSGATLIYVVPLAFFIGGAILGAALFAEPGGIGGGIAGLVSAWCWVSRRVKQRHGDPRFQPHIV